MNLKRLYDYIPATGPVPETDDRARPALAGAFEIVHDMLVARLFFGDAESAAPGLQDGGLTWEKRKEAIDALKPVVYYADTAYANQGEVIKVAAANGYPEFIIVHGDDFEAIKRELSPQCRLVHLREWREMGWPATKPFSPFARQRWHV